jgi:hypothetical protein
MFDLDAFFTEAEGKLRAAVPELRVVKWSEKPQAPGAMFLLPDTIERSTYRGMWTVKDVVLVVAVGKAVARQALKDVFRLGTAAATALDPVTTWTTCADVTLTTITFDTVSFAGAPDVYLGALLHFNIIGTGA